MADASITQFHVTVAHGGVTAANGFRSGAVASGIKKKAGALDLAVIATDQPVPAAALFTTNLAQAAPVLVSKRHLEVERRHRARGCRERRLRECLHGRRRAGQRSPDGQRSRGGTRLHA